MTNAQIIFNESMELMKAGTIGTTGRSYTTQNADGETVTVYEPEPIHTYNGWKERGRQVKRGEHAKAAFMIWKAGKGKTETEDASADGETAKTRLFMKKAFFFTYDQTEAAKAATA